MTETTAPWGHIILGSFLVQIVAFSGLVLSVCLHLWQRRSKGTTSVLRSDSIIFRILIPSFATGAIAATAVYLLIPESFHYFILSTAGGGDSHDDHGHRFLSEDDHDHGHDDHGHDDHGDEHHSEVHEAGDGHEGHDDHHDESFAWKFGTCILAGFVFPAFLSILFPRRKCFGDTALPAASAVPLVNNSVEKENVVDVSNVKKENVVDASEIVDASVNAKTTGDGDCEECSICNEEMEKGFSDENQGAGGCDECSLCDDEQPPSSDVPINWTLAFNTLLGDSLCNLVDGIFIGTAFMLCDKSTAYSIVASTIYHEIAQEISDYTILTQQCGFTPIRALAANFAVGTTVLLGAIIVATTNVSNLTIGCILAFSAGVYLYLCGVELLTKVINSRRNAKEAVYFFLFVAFGAVPIGLVLLNHGHC